MDPITFKCPACAKPLTVPKAAASAEGPCPTCGALIQGPGATGSPRLVGKDPAGAKPEGAAAAAVATKPATAEKKTPVKASPSAKSPSDQPQTNGHAKSAVAAPPEKPSTEKPAPKDKKTEAPAKPEPKPVPAAEKPTEKPTEKPAPKAPAPAAAATKEAPRVKRRGLGLVNHLALHLLGIVVALTIGYQFGQRAGSREPIDSIPLVSKKNSTPVEKPTPEPEPEVTPPVPDEEEAVGDDDTQAEATPAQAALLAFLSAPDWSSRQVYVLHPEMNLAKMKETAEQEGDGPIEIKGLAKVPTRDQEKERIFEVVTEQHPNGFPVSLTMSGGQWLVDWQGFAECYYEALSRHGDAEVGAKGSFRVLLRPDESGDVDYLLSPPTVSATYPARIERESAAHKRISSIIKYYTSNFPDEFAKSIAEGGIPLILELTKANPDSGCRFLITDFVSTTWSPTPPQASNGDDPEA